MKIHHHKAKSRTQSRSHAAGVTRHAHRKTKNSHAGSSEKNIVVPKHQPRTTFQEARHETYSPMETSEPDQDDPGHGPMGEEGEGDRQNDEFSELEHIKPKP